MTPAIPNVTPLTAAETRERLDDLAGVLADVVEGGASVSFMAPFGADAGRAYWRGVADAAAAGRVVPFAAWLDGRVAGTVQLGLATPPNQPHRADVMKLLVHRRARRRGLARLLMAALEAEARRRGRTLLTLDTVTGGPAEGLYAALGFVRVGIIPGYALFPAGGLCATTLFYKTLAGDG